jgi:arginyl-tRNA synthetase
LNLPEEVSVLRRLGDFPDFVSEAAAAREPHRLTAYIHDLAKEFQSYYTRLQTVHGDTILPQRRHQEGPWRDTWDWDKTAARLAWVEAVRQVLATALGLLGVSAPDRMTREQDEPDDAHEGAPAGADAASTPDATSVE